VTLTYSDNTAFKTVREELSSCHTPRHIISAADEPKVASNLSEAALIILSEFEFKGQANTERGEGMIIRDYQQAS
jgi:hypothetical protein